jgi:hypothetical protein
MVFDVLEYLGVQPTDADRDSIMQTPTESVDAFLAFSKGLEFAALGMFEEAIEQFELALQFDGGFDLASTELSDAQISFDNQRFGSSTPSDLENSFFQDVITEGLGNGQLLTEFIDPTDNLQPGNNNPTSPPTKPPVVGRSRTSANVSGNIDGD